ncbi:MAG: O-methyltransferase [Halolamina sp.]
MVLSDDVARFVRATGPEHTPVQESMAAFAERNEFPIIGPDAGGVLRHLARLTDAERVFEFGSGFGYSASWVLRGGADHVVLTEFDEDELRKGESFLAEAGLAERATFELGDAVETVDDHPGPFDVVLVDHQKHRYAEAFAAVREKIPAGGVVVADNVMRGSIDFDGLVAHVDDGVPLPDDAGKETVGIAEYLRTVRADDTFETSVLPVGSGLAVSVRTE